LKLRSINEVLEEGVVVNTKKKAKKDVDIKQKLCKERKRITEKNKIL
jgi:hypothetical protein